MWCEALSSRVGVEAALKGESGGGTGIVVETSRFVDFLTSNKIKTRSTAVSNISKVADSISVLVFFFKLEDLGPPWHSSDVIFCEHLRIFMKSKE